MTNIAIIVLSLHGCIVIYMYILYGLEQVVRAVNGYKILKSFKYELCPQNKAYQRHYLMVI